MIRRSPGLKVTVGAKNNGAGGGAAQKKSVQVYHALHMIEVEFA